MFGLNSFKWKWSLFTIILLQSKTALTDSWGKGSVSGIFLLPWGLVALVGGVPVVTTGLILSRVGFSGVPWVVLLVVGPVGRVASGGVPDTVVFPVSVWSRVGLPGGWLSVVSSGVGFDCGGSSESGVSLSDGLSKLHLEGVGGWDGNEGEKNEFHFCF